MSDGISSSVSGIAEVEAYLRDLPPELDKASIKAINQTIRQHKSKIAGLIAAAEGVPKSVLTRRRRMQSRLAKQNQPLGVLWAGLNPLPAIDLGKTPADFSGSFYATVKPGGQPYRGIFERIAGVYSPSRLAIWGKSNKHTQAIRQVWTQLTQADGVMRQQEAVVAQALLDNFNEALADGQ